VLTKQAKIASIAAKYATVQSLNYHLDVDLLEEAYRLTRKDGAVGVDEVTGSDFSTNLEHNLEVLAKQARDGSYRAPPVRRAYIPKANGEKRGLGIPTLGDKVLQRGMVMLLEPIYETMFYECSYGFRPGRSAHDCIKAIHQFIHKIGGGFVVDVDIRQYFDSIPHNALRNALQLKVQDKAIIRLVSKWLNAGVMEEGKVSFSDVGSPQGGVISPLLSNIYLHYTLDSWFYETVLRHCEATAELFRYADDFLIICKSRSDAERILRVLHKRFERFGLKLHPEKTRLVDFRRPRPGEKSLGFDFLGFHFYWGYSRKGYRVVKLKTEKGRLSRTLRRFHALCRSIMHWRIADQLKRLNRSLIGHYNYFGVAYNQRAVWSVRYWVAKIWRYWLNRRSQKRRMPWYRFMRTGMVRKLAYPKRVVLLW